MSSPEVHVKPREGQWTRYFPLSHSRQKRKFVSDGIGTKHLTAAGRIERLREEAEIEKLERQNEWDNIDV